MKKNPGLNIEEMYPARGVDALDMEIVSLEEAGLEDNYQGDTVPAAQRAYYLEESGNA